MTSIFSLLMLMLPFINSNVINVKDYVVRVQEQPERQINYDNEIQDLKYEVEQQREILSKQNDLIEKLQETLNKEQATIRALTERMSFYETKIIDKDNAVMELQRLKTNLRAENNNITLCNNSSANITDYDRRSAFSAYLHTSMTKVFSLQIMVFDTILSNVVSSYNSTSGIFTCNVPGTYVFNHKLSVNHGNYLMTSILKNGLGVAWNEATGSPEGDGTASTMAVVELKCGDVVWVRTGTSSPGTIVNALHTTFSGFLLY